MNNMQSGNKSIKIGEDFIVGGEQVFVIAEIGANHCGSLECALDAIDAAAESGADAVKFQNLDINELYNVPSLKIKNLHSIIDTDLKWFSELKARCDKKGLIFFSSPTYIEAVDALDEIGVSLYKIASAQVATFPQILRRVAAKRKPVLLSTGLVTYSGLEKAIRIIQKENNSEYIILHCSSIYPVSPEKVFLGRMEIYRQMFGCPVGFSDHTQGISVPLAAVALGAKVIEKHFNPYSIKESPDAAFSLSLQEFKQMVTGIRQIEKATRSAGRDSLEAEEEAFQEAVRYRMFLKKEKKAGEGFCVGDFYYKRDAEGVDCIDERVVIDKMKCAMDIEKKSLLSWCMLQGK